MRLPVRSYSTHVRTLFDICYKYGKLYDHCLYNKHFSDLVSKDFGTLVSSVKDYENNLLRDESVSLIKIINTRISPKYN